MPVRQRRNPTLGVGLPARRPSGRRVGPWADRKETVTVAGWSVQEPPRMTRFMSADGFASGPDGFTRGECAYYPASYQSHVHSQTEPDMARSP